MATVHNPNNWHWIDKNCLPWANVYFQERLPNLSVTKDDFEISIINLKPITGDCDVTQRKGKIRCIFELNVEFSVKLINNKDETPEEVVYDAKLLEFEHDQEDDEYQFDIKNGKSEYRKLVRERLIPEVLKVLKQFQPDLLDSHKPQMQHNTD